MEKISEAMSVIDSSSWTGLPSHVRSAKYPYGDFMTEADDHAMYREYVREERRQRLGALAMLWGRWIVDERSTSYRTDGVICYHRKRDENSDKGGTMRLGAQECRLRAGTLSRELYGQDVVRERHRHRYEFNNRYRQSFEDLGLVIAGKSMDDLLVEMVELPNHPWFVACQAHPEFTSTPRDGHPLFIGFVRAAREQKAVREAPRFVAAGAKEAVA